MWANNNRQLKNSKEVASGSRINQASDDAAGLAISEHFKASIKSIDQAKRNNFIGISIVQTAEGGMDVINKNLVRLRELGMQAASDAIGDSERGMIQYEVNQMETEINRMARASKWRGIKLLTGESDDVEFHVGVYNEEGDRLIFRSKDNNATTDGLDIDGLDYSNKHNARDALKKIDAAITKVSGIRANFGAMQTRLEHSLTNLNKYHENYSASNSQIRDADIAEATANLARDDLLMNASTSTLAQANVKASHALKLVG